MSDPQIETTIAPWLAVSDAEAAVAFYTEAFGAVETYRLDDGGRVVVAQLAVGAAPLWVQEHADAGQPPLDAASVRMILTVRDPDAMFDQAVAAGATPVAAVADAHGWRTGRVHDPFGFDWELARPLAGG